MKKSLFAVAAVTAFAGAAQAQSSVTVYGLLDVGYVGANARVSESGGGAGFQNGQKKVTTNSFNQSGESTSRLGFKGTEDLGNGTSALFTAEFALYPQESYSSGNSVSGLVNRQTFVGLKKNGIGQVAIGLQQTGVFNAVAATDPGQMNNIVGNVIYPGSTGFAAPTSASTNGSTTATSAVAGGAGFTNRTGNTLSFQSDSFAGFRANAAMVLNNKNETESVTPAVGTAGVGGNTNASGWGLGADYTWKKLFVTAQYQAFKQITTATNAGASNVGSTATAGAAIPVVWSNPTANGAIAAPAAGGLSASAVNVQDNQFYAGATYDFGILKAYANYLNRKVTSTASSNYYLSRQAEQIGVRSFVTPVVEAWASAGLGRYTAFGAGTPTVNFNAWQLGSNYYLSKRTNLYAIYGQTITGTSAIGSTTASASASNYAIGVRHTF